MGLWSFIRECHWWFPVTGYGVIRTPPFQRSYFKKDSRAGSHQQSFRWTFLSMGLLHSRILSHLMRTPPVSKAPKKSTLISEVNEHTKASHYPECDLEPLLCGLWEDSWLDESLRVAAVSAGCFITAIHYHGGCRCTANSSITLQLSECPGNHRMVSQCYVFSLIITQLCCTSSTIYRCIKLYIRLYHTIGNQSFNSIHVSLNQHFDDDVSTTLTQ